MGFEFPGGIPIDPSSITDVATGFLVETSGAGYLITILFLLAIGIIVVLKLFDILQRMVVIAAISAFFPIVTNIAAKSLFGTGIFDVTPKLIVGFVLLGYSVYGIYRVVSISINILEKVLRVVSAPLRFSSRRKTAKTEKKEKKEFKKGLQEVKRLKDEKDQEGKAT